MLELIHSLTTFLSLFIVTYIISIFNIFVDEQIYIKNNFKKGFNKRHTTILLNYLRTNQSHKMLLVRAVAKIPLFIALMFLPTLGGETYFDPDHSLVIFVLLMSLERFFTYLGKNFFNNYVDIGFIEKTITPLMPIFIFLFSIIALTGLDKISEIISHQKDGGALIFKYPPIIFILSFVFYLLIENIVGKSFFVATKTMDIIEKSFLKTVWLTFFVCLFWGGSGLDIPLKVMLLNLLGGFIFAYFYNLRADLEEKFILWEIVPSVMLILIISLVLIGLNI